MLQGFTVGITADRRWDEQASLFERRGATVVHGPTIRTLQLGSEVPLREATERVIARPPDVLIANTGLGIRSWFGAAESWDLGAQLLDSLATTTIFARGPKASGAVHSLGLEVQARAPSERLAEAVDLALPSLGRSSVVVLQVDGTGDSPELERLRATGAEVIVVPVYEWKLPADERPAIRLARAAVAGKVHAVTFTTGPAIRTWMAMAAEDDLDAELRAALTDGRVVVGCVGPVCAEVAQREGIDSEHLVVPAAFRLGPLVRAVADRLVARQVTIRALHGELVLTGTCVRVDGAVLELSDVEAKLLAVLGRQPNAVIGKAELARQVWADDGLDPHVVEVTVARLRRRLGPHGAAIASVHRRGYVLHA